MPERRPRTLVPPKRAGARREGAKFQESFKIRPHGASPTALTPRKKSSEGVAHEWTSEEARQAGHKGGKVAHQHKKDAVAPARSM
jgi:hypothetical protein